MNILFISELLPLNTYASEVVFYRHFKKLVDEGHNIHILTDQNSYNSRKQDIDPLFTIHLIPNRKWYYPPYKSYGIYQRLRFFDYFENYLKDIIKTHKIENLLGFIYGNFLAAFCAYAQRRSKLPLYSFFHDDPEELNGRERKWLIHKNTKAILSASSIVFVASLNFTSKWKQFEKKFTLLYPIPEEGNAKPVIKNKYSLNTIAYAGSVYNEIIPYLEKTALILNISDIKLEILGNNEKARYLASTFKNVRYNKLFETPKESNEFLIENAVACIIPYPINIEEMPWINTCFPSKFIQYTILGIPTIIIAPEESAIGRWCIEYRWPLYLNNYEAHALTKLIKEELFTEKTLNALNLLQKETFNPTTIHAIFSSHFKS